MSTATEGAGYRKVYKYKIGGDEVVGLDVVVEMPCGAVQPQIAHVDYVGGAFYLWAVVDIRAPASPRTFRVVATGVTVPNTYVFVGTATIPSAQEFWHVFERLL